MNKEQIDKELQKRVVQPFLDALKEESEKTIRTMMSRSSEIARDAVEGTLNKEEQRYESERSQKGAPHSKAYVASVFAALCSFMAAESALSFLQENLKETL